jgi:hypothetical protein
MDFAAWLDRAWDDHAADAAGVARRIDDEGLALAASDVELNGLARLAHHVLGEHLGRIAEGRALLRRLAEHVAAGDATRAASCLFDASLALTGGEDLRAGLTRSERIRATALAAGNLAGRDAERASTLLRDALAEAEVSPLADDDPALRALAVAGNNLACTLEDQPARSEAERALMILAAQTARRYWGRVGTWLETERAEYRLAHSWLAAGDPVQARRHAVACLEIVHAHGDPPLEAFFGWEALGRAEAAAGRADHHARAVAEARSAFARLDEGDRGGCRTTLDRLVAALPAAGAAAQY